MKELKLEVKKLERRDTKTPTCGDGLATCIGEWFGTCINASGILKEDLLRVMLIMMGYLSPVCEACGL
jgi:hypothetical protein